MKIFSMDTNLVHTFFGNNFFDLTMGRTLKNYNILVHTKLGYLRYYLWKPDPLGDLRKKSHEIRFFEYDLDMQQRWNTIH